MLTVIGGFLFQSPIWRLLRALVILLLCPASLLWIKPSRRKLLPSCSLMHGKHCRCPKVLTLSGHKTIS